MAHDESNPYASPTENSGHFDQKRNLPGICGVLLAVVALLAVCLAGVSPIFTLASFLAVPALMLSLIALRKPPRRAAAWGLALAITVCFYLPAMIVGLW